MSTLQRRLGLTRFQLKSSLLKQLPNRDTSQESSRDAMAGSQSTRTKKSTRTETAEMASRTRAKNFKKPPADDAPPLSTDDENENSEDQASQGSSAPLPPPILDSSEDELAGRGNIKTTTFQLQPSLTARNGRQFRPGAGGEIDPKKIGKDGPKESRSTGSGTKRKASKEQDEEGESSSQIRSGSPDSPAVPRKQTIKKRYRARKNFKVPGILESIDDSDYVAPAKFKSVPAAKSSPVKAAKFIPLGDDVLSSPRSRGGKQVSLSVPELTDFSDGDVSPAKKPTSKTKSGPKMRVPGKKLGGAARNSKRAANGKKADGAAEDSDLEDSFTTSLPARKFVVPASFSQFEAPSTSVPGSWDSDESGSLSDVPSDISTPSIQGLLDLDAALLAQAARKTTTTTTTLCPWCQAPVEKSQLEGFAKGRRLNVRMQTRFCQSHKKQTALETWKERKYPEVDWARLEARFAAHRGRLLGIINGDASHYRAKLAGRIETGQARDLQKEENLNPGYYGPRGLNVMCDYLVGEFGDLLKEKAVADRVIAGRGSAAFIQSVLVAELAVQLIREDLDVSAESARDIMEESKALGDMVHEEV